MRIYLTGFMGCGKSTVGPLLAERLGVPFVDLDREVERRSGDSIETIFERELEAGFRRRERAALLATGELVGVVVATGGGCPVDPGNRVWTRAHGRRVWLHLPWEALLKRLEETPQPRPLWRSAVEAEALYRERLHAYQDCELEIACSAAEDADEVAARIFALLGSMPDPARPRPL